MHENVIQAELTLAQAQLDDLLQKEAKLGNLCPCPKPQSLATTAPVNSTSGLAQHKANPEEEFKAQAKLNEEAKKAEEAAEAKEKEEKQKKEDAQKAEEKKAKEAAQKEKDSKASFDGGYCSCSGGGSPGSASKEEIETIKVKRAEFKQEIERLRKQVEIKKQVAVEEAKRVQEVMKIEASKSEQLKEQAEEMVKQASE